MRMARSRGRAVAEGPLVLRYLPNLTDPPRNRYGVVAGRQSGGSVQRNRLKRVTRESLRALHSNLRPGYDLVVIIRGTVNELPGSEEARQLLTGMLRRAGLLDPAATRESELPLASHLQSTPMHMRPSTMAPLRCCHAMRGARRRGWRC